MSDYESPFLPGFSPFRRDLPLERFLPPYFPKMALRRVNSYIQAGDWVLDPFGNDPYVDLELARAGFRVLVASNNPVPAFILEMLASPPGKQAIGDALLALADLQIGNGQRLEEFINSFYTIPCPKCQKEVAVESLIWDEGNALPVAVTLECPHCGLNAEQPIETSVAQRFKAPPSYNLQRVKALELVAGLNDPLRPLAEEVIRFYPPHALVLIQVLLNKVSSSEFSDAQKKLLQALLLTTSDRINQLWTYPLGKNRPKQLLRPPKYQEMNVWQALIQSQKLWQPEEQEIVLKYWPDLPPQKGGISLFKGRLRELYPLPEPDLINLVYVSLPRRNQAYWNLCGLWSGWLWGREAVDPLRNSLLKQRYDWTWHTKALEKVLSQLDHMVNPKTPVLVQIGELDTMFLMSGILGAQGAGLKLRSFAIDGEETTLQSSWEFHPSQPYKKTTDLSLKQAREAAIELLTARGEATTYFPVFMHTLLSLHIQDLLPDVSDLPNEGTLNELEETLGSVLKDTKTFIRFNPGIALDSGTYWLLHPPASYTPWSDQVEKAVYDSVQQLGTFNENELTQSVFEKCKGLHTPEHELITICLEAYADRLNSENSLWQLRKKEDPAERSIDLNDMREQLKKISAELGFQQITNQNTIIWNNETGNQIYSFFLRSSALIGSILIKHANDPGIKLIVIPGSRSNLVTYKLKRDPNLARIWINNWRFIKYRQIRNIGENPLLSRELFLTQIYEDPPEYQSSQLALF